VTGLPLGLRANWKQFSLLVVINAFVGAMVGLERTVLPLIAEHDFALASKSAALSFILTFGLVKAATNLVAGRLGDRLGRKRVLVVGWLVGLPVPLLVMLAPSWSWIIAANVLLGINQGLTWSMTVVMKIDLAGPAQRGLAMGLNEFAGYIALAVSALATGSIASHYGLRPEPFYLGIAFVALGLALSQFAVRDTTAHVLHETMQSGEHRATPAQAARARSTSNHVGLVNNLNDGLAWGLFPLFFAAAGLSLQQIGFLVFLYPATWGVVQVFAGALSDRLGRKQLIASGMLLQGGALAAIAFAHSFPAWVVANVLLGIGTAMVYPTLLAVVADVAPPAARGAAVGRYRFWRDSGYAVGALIAGALADAFGMGAAILSVGVLTGLAGLYAALRLPETLQPAGSQTHASRRIL
jgi:MFS family permease